MKQRIYDDEYDEECFTCGGEGFVLNDCFEDSCCCADPEASHGYSECPDCYYQKQKQFREQTEQREAKK